MAEKKNRMFACNDLPKRCFQHFKDLKTKSELCDVILQVGEESISAHRIIITAAIPYFREAFESQQYKKEFSMPNIEPSAFKCVIEFAYSCEVNIDDENVRNLLTAASYLGVAELEEACCDFLVEIMEPDNVVDIRELAENLSCSELLSNAECYIKENFEKVSQTESFLKCSSAYIKELISKDDLNVDKEEKVFDAVLKWVKNSTKERETLLPELLRQIRLPLMDPIYLAQIALKEDIIRSSVSSRDLVDEARICISHPELRSSQCSFVTEPRKFMTPTNTNDDSSQYIFKLYLLHKLVAQNFSLDEKKWITKDEALYFGNGGALVSLDKRIYYFYWGDTKEYNPSNNEYRILKNVPTPRVFTSVVAFESKIYLCGGAVGLTASNVVECFDPKRDSWTSVRSMPIHCWNAGAVVALRKHIFVLGGRDEFSAYDTVQRYDPEQNKWRIISCLLAKRYGLGAVAVKDKIYLCGGKTCSNVIPGKLCVTAEMYDPISNTSNFISSMTAARFDFTLLYCRRKLYAIGGEDDAKRLSTFDIYDPESDKWTSGSSTDGKYLVSGAVVI